MHTKPLRVFAALTCLLAFGFCLFHLGGGYPETSIVDWTDVHQRIDGFGGSSADFLRGLTPAQADFFFTPAGIGLSILRTQIIPDLTTCDTEFKEGACSNSNGQILNGELDTAKLAVARGAIVFSTPWSPPGAYKSNGSFRNGGSLLTSHYSDWAWEIATYVRMMVSHGVPIYAVSVQNEPNLRTDYGSCTYTAQEIHDFVPYLYSALHSVGFGSTKIMIAEESKWAFDLSEVAMADPIVASQVGIIAAHGYGPIFQRYRAMKGPVWQTEDASSLSSTYDGGMANGIGWALKIHSYLTVTKINAWVWWFLSNMPHQGEGADNSALTDINGNFPKRAYLTGQWSKFVRPGWYRIGASSPGFLRVSAFKNPRDGSFAIVVVNPTKNLLSQKFSLRGFSTSTVTPWVTSSTLSLAEQSPVPVNGTTLDYAIPASSVITFSGVANSR